MMKGELVGIMNVEGKNKDQRTNSQSLERCDSESQISSVVKNMRSINSNL